ncbi:MAG: Hsp70 family protein, partial [Desulfococcaceae bacterium]
ENPDLGMEHQDVLLTVPASFDAVARELTVKAAEMAGLGQITLLEEPQAAFYAWIEAAGDSWREEVQKGDLVLVCDVGGGTSDFSLINVSEEEGDLVLDRIAVGDHLLVGGDNMDLALAYQVAEELRRSKGKRLDAWQMRGLWHACRKAKEALLSNADAQVHPVTILGRGSSLIGGTTKTDVDAGTVERVVLDGFFPRCERDAQPAAPPRTGIRQMGLSYESDPAVTRHLAHFLSRQSEAGASGHGPGETATSAAPTAILFNGGVMKADRIRERVVDVLGSWQEGENGVGVREIANRNFDLAVARGAAYYGMARRGTGIRIRGGLNRSYYIGVAASMPAVPGMPVPIKALCVAPFGMEEGAGSSLPDQEFVLVVGEPVKFDFLGSTVRLDDAPGTLVDEWEEEIEPITTIETTLDGEPGSTIPVILEVRVTEIGTLELWCVSRENADRRWKLEFNVREQGAE